MNQCIYSASPDKIRDYTNKRDFPNTSTSLLEVNKSFNLSQDHLQTLISSYPKLPDIYPSGVYSTLNRRGDLTISDKKKQHLKAVLSHKRWKFNNFGKKSRKYLKFYYELGEVILNVLATESDLLENNVETA